LLKALRAIEADYIILDLGGDTTFNTLDYFLAADTRIVLTTCDPASYLDAYNFIKMALYRKLTRVFGPETPSDYQRNPAFLASLKKFVNEGLSGTSRRIDALLEDVRKHHSDYFPLLKDLLDRFGPYFVINMADNAPETKQLAERLKKVSHRMLSINLDYIGSIGRNEGIKQCTLDLVPHVIRHPRGILSYFFNQIRFIL
jgi:flagellar biosynthesis protein FlhG